MPEEGLSRKLLYPVIVDMAIHPQYYTDSERELLRRLWSQAKRVPV